MIATLAGLAVGAAVIAVMAWAADLQIGLRIFRSYAVPVTILLLAAGAP